MVRRSAAALLLCAHGRGMAAGGDDVPASLARALRETGAFAQVEACYLRGEPGLAAALDRVGAADVLLVPLLMAEGHTSKVVLPEALAALGPRGDRIRVAPPLGTDPALSALISQEALACCEARGWRATETALVVAGHGTERHGASATSAEEAVTRIAASGRFAQVTAAFLEQAPRLETALRQVRPSPCVVVGFFMDKGAHSTMDIPRLIAATHPAADYAGAIGAHPGIADIVVGLASRATSSAARLS